jgi:hypothetical protein
VRVRDSSTDVAYERQCLRHSGVSHSELSLSPILRAEQCPGTVIKAAWWGYSQTGQGINFIGYLLVRFYVTECRAWS